MKPVRYYNSNQQHRDNSRGMSCLKFILIEVSIGELNPLFKLNFHS